MARAPKGVLVTVLRRPFACPICGEKVLRSGSAPSLTGSKVRTAWNLRVLRISCLTRLLVAMTVERCANRITTACQHVRTTLRTAALPICVTSGPPGPRAPALRSGTGLLVRPILSYYDI